MAEMRVLLDVAEDTIKFTIPSRGAHAVLSWWVLNAITSSCKRSRGRDGIEEVNNGGRDQWAGALCQGMLEPLEAGSHKEWVHPPEPPGGSRPCIHLDFSVGSVRLISDSGLQKPETTPVCPMKPPTVS